ncbi:MAG: hypothetical protein GC156_16135 [Actinomycetales bacterium]|nr:hypothetical protein [Actinomycetales bacterium]
MDRTEFDERLLSLRETRVRLPELVRNRHAARRRRPIAGHGGRLLLIESDDAARGWLGGPGDHETLVDRGDLLWDLASALARSGVDGIIATSDVLDDLLILEALEDRLAIGTMSAGALAGASTPADSGWTGFDADVLAASHLDGGRMRLVIDPQEAGTTQALAAAGRAMTDLSGHSLLAIVEPSWALRRADGADVDTSVHGMARALGIAAGLGGRSAYTWLVLPALPSVADVLPTTTLPMLIRLSDTAVPDEQDTWVRLLGLAGVRGLVVPAVRLRDAGAGVLERALDVVAEATTGAWASAP